MNISTTRIIAGLASIALAATAAAAPRADAAVTYQQVLNWHSGKCLDVAGGSQASGARVQQYTCNGTPAQQWTMVPTDHGYFLLRVAVSGQCLTVKNGSFANNAPVVQMPCSRAYYQQWTQSPSGVPGWPSLVARHSDMGLTILSESLLDGAQAVQYDLDYDGPGALHAGDWLFQ